MTQEDKELLLKDICARLPYETMFYSDRYGEECLLSIDLEYNKVNELYSLEEIKPYLRPMSSMTEEEFVYFMNLKGKMLQSYEIKNIMKKVLNTTQSCGIVTQLDKYSNKIDWLNANQFDYRGLIPKGLAIKVTKENNSYKK